MYISHLTVCIIPEFDSDDNAIALAISMKIERPDLVSNGELLSFLRKIASVPSHDYGDDAIKACDASGALLLRIVDDDKNHRRWYVNRATAGDVDLEFRATPRKVDRTTPIGARIDLRTDEGGLQGCGTYFLPIPSSAQSMDKVFDMSVQWNLEHAPPGTRAIWTFGEGPEPVVRVGPVSELVYSAYSVGPIQGTPKASNTREAGNENYYGYYWFGTPPTSVTRLEAINKRLFEHMSEFFEDPPSADNAYRIFVRCANPARGFGGSAFIRSYVLEWDKDTISSISDDEIFLLLSHEMVHNWPLMGKNGDEDSAENGWYSEGIADYYCQTLPYRFGLYSRSRWLDAMNIRLASYYTNPQIGMSNEEAERLAWEDSSAQRIPYSRGCIYLIKVNAQILRASGGRRSLDSIVLELLRKKTQGKPFGLEAWLELIQAEIGSVAKDEYYKMAEGGLVQLPQDALGPDIQLRRKDMEMLEIGYEDNNRVITSIKAGSRAEQAGLKVDDKIVANTFEWQVGDQISKNMVMTIKRGEETMKIEYWPRSWHKVPCWQCFDSRSA